ncbi:MAG: purine-nucleoside phosphorylase, partial [Thermodesulfobacteriota bacterium]|nr:purine-nucleoside phosphorylase [Thermodesulfobacteriota bacterium]
MLDKILQTEKFLASRMTEPPLLGMITGTGLGSLTERMTVEFRLPYEEIPNFPRSTVEGHKGSLVVGRMAGKRMIALDGRFHIYEGYSPQEVTFPVRVMAMLGIK